jgi:PPOX class probable F420-dependent enzyme
MGIADEKFVSLTTYRKNGEAKELPVWIVDLGDGTSGFTTHGESWKCKRIRNDNRIMLQPCDQRGNLTPGTEKVSGTAVLATGADFDRVRAAVKKKYGFMVNVIIVMNKVRGLFGKGGDSDTAVIMTVDE